MILVVLVFVTGITPIMLIAALKPECDYRPLAPPLSHLTVRPSHTVPPRQNSRVSFSATALDDSNPMAA